MINLRASNYFNNLPKMVQESIMQSGKDFESEDDLFSFVNNLDDRGE